MVEKLVAPSKKAVLVEVGCGTGGNVSEFSSGYSCVGIDINQRAIDLAKELYPASRFICGEAPGDVKTDLQNASIVLLLDVLEHVRDDFLLLSQLLNSVRTGCFIVLTVPAGPDLWTQHDVSFGHFRRYHKARLEQTWQGLSVSTLICSFFNSRLYYPVKMVRSFNRRFGRTSGSENTDLMQPATVMNWVLHRVFASEAGVLSNALTKSESAGFRKGVSLIAVLRREEGEIPVRRKPAGLEQCDFFDPESGQFESVLDATKPS